jgi:hypothetical protein
LFLFLFYFKFKEFFERFIFFFFWDFFKFNMFFYSLISISPAILFIFFFISITFLLSPLLPLQFFSYSSPFFVKWGQIGVWNGDKGVCEKRLSPLISNPVYTRVELIAKVGTNLENFSWKVFKTERPIVWKKKFFLIPLVIVHFLFPKIHNFFSIFYKMSWNRFVCVLNILVW